MKAFMTRHHETVPEAKASTIQEIFESISHELLLFICYDWLGIILSQVGYSVCAFVNSRTARTNLHDSPRLLISDYHMPKLTGTDLAVVVVKETPRTKVILFSANLSPTDPECGERFM
jgi:CheY-like chemotaxis protein